MDCSSTTCWTVFGQGYSSSYATFSLAGRRATLLPPTSTHVPSVGKCDDISALAPPKLVGQHSTGFADNSARGDAVGDIHRPSTVQVSGAAISASARARSGLRVTVAHCGTCQKSPLPCLAADQGRTIRSTVEHVVTLLRVPVKNRCH